MKKSTKYEVGGTRDISTCLRGANLKMKTNKEVKRRSNLLKFTTEIKQIAALRSQ